MIKNDFPQYAAEIFRERLKELGMSRYRFIREFPVSNQGTLERILNGMGGTNVQTMAHYCECIGLELIIQKKKDNESED